MSDLNERLNQAYEDRKAIDKNIADLKKQIEDNDKKFYIGDKFTSGNTVYQLIKHDNKVALVIVEGHQSDIGVHTRGGWSEIPVKTEKRNRKFVKNLPTIYPNVFGLDKKYGWYG